MAEPGAARAGARRDPALIPRWVEETLRYDNSTQALARLVARDVELHGEKLRAGEKVVLLIGSANRDERAFPDPDRFDLLPRHAARASPSARARTSASARRSRGSKGASRSRRCCAASAASRSSPTGIVRVHSVNVRGFAALPIRFAA